MAWRRAFTYKRLLETRQGCGIDIEDIVQLGLIGIWDAIKRYDPKRGGSFSTVAYNWIHHHAKSVSQALNTKKRGLSVVPLPQEDD